MTKTKNEKTYAQLKSELDDALAWFESETIDVDEAIEKYKHALSLTKELEVYLKEAENTLKKLT